MGSVSDRRDSQRFTTRRLRFGRRIEDRYAQRGRFDAHHLEHYADDHVDTDVRHPIHRHRRAGHASTGRPLARSSSAERDVRPATAATTASTATTAATATAPPPPPPPQSLTLVAQNITFSPTGLSASAGAPLTITLDNRDAGVQHDVTIFAPDGSQVAATALTTGPGTASTTFTPVAGTYSYKCTVHPQQMFGRIAVR